MTLVISSWTETYRATVYIQQLPALTELHIEMDGSSGEATDWGPLLREDGHLTKVLMASQNLLVFQLRLSARPLRIFLGILQQFEDRMQAHPKRRSERK